MLFQLLGWSATVPVPEVSLTMGQGMDDVAFNAGKGAAEGRCVHFGNVCVCVGGGGA